MVDMVEGTRRDAGKAIQHTGGQDGEALFRVLSNKLRGMRVHRWNAEHFIVFQKMSVQQKFHFTTA